MKYDIEPLPFNVFEWAIFALAAGAWLHWAWHFTSLPIDVAVPMQYGLHGEPVWTATGRWWSLLYPSISLLMAVAVAIAHGKPHQFSYMFAITRQNRKRQYALAQGAFTLIMLQASVLLFYIQYLSPEVLTGQVAGLNSYIVQGIIASLFVTLLGYVLLSYKSR